MQRKEKKMRKPWMTRGGEGSCFLWCGGSSMVGVVDGDAPLFMFCES